MEYCLQRSLKLHDVNLFYVVRRAQWQNHEKNEGIHHRPTYIQRFCQFFHCHNVHTGLFSSCNKHIRCKNRMWKAPHVRYLSSFSPNHQHSCITIREWAENSVECATIWLLIFYKIEFWPGRLPRPHWGAYDAPPDLLVGWGGGYPSPISTPLDAFGINTWCLWPLFRCFRHLWIRQSIWFIPPLVPESMGLSCTHFMG